MNTQRKTLIGLATSLFYGFLTVSFASAATEGGSEESSCSFVNGSVRFSFVSKATESATLSGSDSISISCTVGVCQRRSKSLPLGRSKSRPVCLIFGYVFWPLQGPEDIVRH